MGAGKSTVGRALGKSLGWNFLDLDPFVEEPPSGLTVAAMPGDVVLLRREPPDALDLSPLQAYGPLLERRNEQLEKASDEAIAHPLISRYFTDLVAGRYINDAKIN